MASLSAMAVSSASVRPSAPLSDLCHSSRSRTPRAKCISFLQLQQRQWRQKLGGFSGSPLLDRNPRRRGGVTTPATPITAQAKSEDADGVGTAGTGAIAGGLVANPIVLWSLYTLKTTGCGLPPGPGGSVGALEGVSYLVVLGVIGWSVFTKVRTGSGLPAGPFGLLGAVEGVSYLSLLAIAVVFGLQFLEFGFIPGPLPGDQCFG